MKVDTFEKKLLETGVHPIHLIMGMGGNVKWFVCKDNLVGGEQETQEFCIIVYDEKGHCFINPKRYTETDLDKSYNIVAIDEERIVVNNVTYYSEPLCDLTFPSEP